MGWVEDPICIWPSPEEIDLKNLKSAALPLENFTLFTLCPPFAP